MQIQEDGTLSFGGPRTEILVREKLKKWPRKYVNCEVDTRETVQKRRFFEGPVTHYWFFQNPRSKWKTFLEARENLKLRWNALNSYDADGTPVRIPQSTMMSNKKFGEMLMEMQQDWTDEGYEFPDHDDFERWLLTNPPPDAEYPPVQKLKEKYMSNFL